MSKLKAISLMALLLAFVYLLILQVYAVWPFTIDDMYISLRYAKNWVQDGALLWNLNEAPVEGYSNFSFVILAAAALHWGINPVILLKGVGVASLFLTIAGLYCLSRFLFSTWVALIPCFWLLAYNGQILWAVSGLETTAFQALLVWGLFCLIKGTGYSFVTNKGVFSRKIAAIDIEKPQFLLKSAMLSSIFFALACLTRPEAPALVIFFYVIAFWDTWRRPAFQAVFLSMLVFLFIWLPYFLWRWHYYHYLFPNPVYCKGLSPSGALVLDKHYLHLSWPFLLLSCWAIFKSKKVWACYFAIPSLLYLILLAGADPIVAFANRLFLPAFMLLLPLSLWGLCLVLQILLSPAKGWVFPGLLIMAAVWIALVCIPKKSLADFRYFALNPQKGEKLRMDVVKWLDTNVSQNSEVLLSDCGLIPYLSRLKFIDSYCLNNKQMIQLPVVERYRLFCEKMMQDKPQVIILTSLFENKKRTYTPVDECLHQKLINNQLYNRQAIYQTGDSDHVYAYEIYTLAP